jgi:hypothetical protein
MRRALAASTASPAAAIGSVSRTLGFNAQIPREGGYYAALTCVAGPTF